MATRRRLDIELVRRGLAPSRTAAAELISAGRVLVGRAVAEKSARQVGADEPVEVMGPPPRFVGRGGQKLAEALETFGVVVRGALALDAGASTGGFTDCLLQMGASQVWAVDVGRAQLHERIRADARVRNMERTDVRSLRPGPATPSFDVVVADLSFISLRSVAPGLVALARSGGDLVVLVKPQFEAGRHEVSKGKGVIRDPRIWSETLHSCAGTFEDAGAAMMGVMPSPLRGAGGNVEFLAHFKRDVPVSPAALRGVAEAVERACRSREG